jgi:hypothetical protein
LRNIVGAESVDVAECLADITSVAAFGFALGDFASDEAVVSVQVSRLNVADLEKVRLVLVWVGFLVRILVVEFALQPVVLSVGSIVVDHGLFVRGASGSRRGWRADLPGARASAPPHPTRRNIIGVETVDVAERLASHFGVRAFGLALGGVSGCRTMVSVPVSRLDVAALGQGGLVVVIVIPRTEPPPGRFRFFGLVRRGCVIHSVYLRSI